MIIVCLAMFVIVALMILDFRAPNLALIAISRPAFDSVGLEHVFAIVALVADVALERPKSRSIKNDVERISLDELSQISKKIRFDGPRKVVNIH